MTARKYRWLAVFAAACALSLGIAACGDDDNAPTLSARASATATATADETATAKPTRTTRPTVSLNPTATFEDVDEGTPQIDECNLATIEELNDLGVDTFAAGRADPSDPDTCIFEGADGYEAAITVLDLSGYSDPKAAFEAVDDISHTTFENFPGEEAYYDSYYGLSVLSNKYEIDVSVYDASADPVDDNMATYQLTDIVLGNLPDR